MLMETTSMIVSALDAPPPQQPVPLLQQLRPLLKDCRTRKIVQQWLIEEEKAETAYFDSLFGVRASRCLHRLGINTLAKLTEVTADDLIICRNFGMSSLEVVRRGLATHGLQLKGDPVEIDVWHAKYARPSTKS